MKFVRCLLLATMVSLGGISFSSVAHAAEPSPAEIAVARRLFREATQLEGDKKWDQAEAKLREALAIKETPGLRYHVAYCQEQQGKLVEALVDYDRADEMIQHGAAAADVAELVGPARDSLRKRVPGFNLVLPDGVKDVTLEVDGEKVAPALTHQRVPVNPGKHKIVVSAPGRQTYEQVVPFAEGETRGIPLTLPLLAKTSMDDPKGGAGPGPEGDTGTVSTSSSGWSTRTWVLIGEGAFTAVALGTGVYFAIDKGKAQDQVDEASAAVDKQYKTLNPGATNTDAACSNPTDTDLKDYCDQLSSLSDQRDRSKTLSTIGFIGAGVGAAATAATFILWQPKEKSVARTLRVAPSPMAGGGAFLSVSGAF
ncbi:MAG: hypothetical protein KC776_36595 [Myxococcales bacterium]|nr:hypothetical protein [Myxococcales bacterium]MCB9582838.1 hypothetical protein [Polyangiaceae bacterium]